MFEKLEVAWQYIAYTFGVGAAIGLFLLADMLTSPIKHRGYQELRDEMMGNFSFSFANIFREAFDKSILSVEKTYSVLTNMFLPMLFIMVAAIILLILEQHLLGIGVILRCKRDCEGFHLNYPVQELKNGDRYGSFFLFH
ncbi:hypothetical protein [Neobacillus drentensis]|uniref:hypothetical protein n=1 Tax=Neobacillus drentensis TaxID=220684 RepID=UPI003001CCCF